MKKTYPLNEYGYVTTWLISGRLDTPVDPTTRTIVNQSEYERHQRLTIHDDNITSVPHIQFGAAGINDDLPWRLYPSGPNSFVDLYSFYNTIFRSEFWCATSIMSPCDQQVEADIWNYPSYDAWLNGEHVSACIPCQHSPMKRNRVIFSLKAGENVFFLRAQNACARDTRNIVALSFPDSSGLEVTYPGEYDSTLETCREALDWVYSVRWDGEKAVAPAAVPENIDVTINDQAVGGTVFEIPADQRVIRVCAKVGDFAVERKMEIRERILPAEGKPVGSVEETRRAFLRSLADRRVPENDANSQKVYTTYARLCHGYGLDENDIRAIRAALSEADAHRDCSDFRMSYLLASVKKGFFPDWLAEEVHKTALHYSYWFDEKAVGAMCYTSENHSLLFHTCQMLAGMLWPDDVFVRSGRLGREQLAIAEGRIDKWLAEIEEEGFGEFLSGGYLPITIAAMLLVVDFGEPSLSRRGAALIDEIFYSLAHNAFRGVVYGPQGRIYRGVITPWEEGTQALLYFATGTASPRGIGALGSWLAAFSDTKYRFPSDLEARLVQKGMYYGKAKGTRIQTFKGDHFMLTSLPLEVIDGQCVGKFKPGAIGYQQHLSYATLGGACIVFPQHPGLSYDAATIRPGYWYGNGHFPAQKQWDNVLGQVFPLSPEHPIPFTHLYFPTRCFDEWEQDGNWLYARRGEGYIAVWCSNSLTLFDGDIVQGSDFRAGKGPAAYLTVCGDSPMNGSFDEFKEYARQLSPVFDRERLVLSTVKGSIG